MKNSRIDEDVDATSVRHAEGAVHISMDRFETAMEHLADHVEQTSKKLQHVMDLADRQKNELKDLRIQASRVLAPVRPYVERMRRNPRPFAIAACTLAAGLLGMTYLNKRGRRRERYTEPGVYRAGSVPVSPDVPPAI